VENGQPIACFNVALPGILDLASGFTTLPDTVKALDNVPYIFIIIIFHLLKILVLYHLFLPRITT